MVELQQQNLRPPFGIGWCGQLSQLRRWKAVPWDLMSFSEQLQSLVGKHNSHPLFNKPYWLRYKWFLFLVLDIKGISKHGYNIFLYIYIYIYIYIIFHCYFIFDWVKYMLLGLDIMILWFSFHGLIYKKMWNILN
jgi:hypothetical protein